MYAYKVDKCAKKCRKLPKIAPLTKPEFPFRFPYTWSGPRVLGRTHPGGDPGANRKSIYHRCHPITVAFVWKLTREIVDMRVASRVASNMAHTRQSRQYSGLGVKAKVLEIVEVVPISLGNGLLWIEVRIRHAPPTSGRLHVLPLYASCLKTSCPLPARLLVRTCSHPRRFGPEAYTCPHPDLVAQPRSTAKPSSVRHRG